MELITRLSKKLQIPKSEADKRLNDTVAVIKAELLKNNVVSCPTFGNFEVRKRNERLNVNPINGKRMLIPPKLIVGFKASTVLKEKLKKHKEATS